MHSQEGAASGNVRMCAMPQPLFTMYRIRVVVVLLEQRRPGLRKRRWRPQGGCQHRGSCTDQKLPPLTLHGVLPSLHRQMHGWGRLMLTQQEVWYMEHCNFTHSSTIRCPDQQPQRRCGSCASATPGKFHQNWCTFQVQNRLSPDHGIQL
jgi:hypothetical protein